MQAPTHDFYTVQIKFRDGRETGLAWITRCDCVDGALMQFVEPVGDDLKLHCYPLDVIREYHIEPMPKRPQA